MIQSPDSSELNQLCDHLRAVDGADGDRDAWPVEKLALCGRAGVYRWFVPESAGGLGWSEADIAAGYLQLSAACLTTTFILTQQVSALKRVAGTTKGHIRQHLLPRLVAGEATATVGISHLTTSRRHLGKPALHATATATGFVVNGYSPWVTGGCGADFLVMGAEQSDGMQILFAVDKTQPGISVQPSNQLMALSASHTGAVTCQDVMVDADSIIAGPAEAVLSSGKGGGTGGLQTSTLAIGLAQAAVGFVNQEAAARPDLQGTGHALKLELEDLRASLLALADGDAHVAIHANAQDLRAAANSFVLRATQAALVAAKGAGYVQGHPVERWCREAMFFLVWSCPQPVLDANLCEFAGLGA